MWRFFFVKFFGILFSFILKAGNEMFLTVSALKYSESPSINSTSVTEREPSQQKGRSDQQNQLLFQCMITK